MRLLPTDAGVGVAGVAGVTGIASVAFSDFEGSSAPLPPFLLDRWPDFDDEVSGVSARRLASPSRAASPLADLVSPPSTDGEPSPPRVSRTDLASNARAMSRAEPISFTPRPRRASASDPSGPENRTCTVSWLSVSTPKNTSKKSQAASEKLVDNAREAARVRVWGWALGAMSSRLLRRVGALAASTSRASSSPTAAFARTFVAGSVENHAIGARTAPNVARRAFARGPRHGFAPPSTGGPHHGIRVDPLAPSRLDRRALCVSPSPPPRRRLPAMAIPRRTKKSTSLRRGGGREDGDERRE